MAGPPKGIVDAIGCSFVSSRVVAQCRVLGSRTAGTPDFPGSLSALFLDHSWSASEIRIPTAAPMMRYLSGIKVRIVERLKVEPN